MAGAASPALESRRAWRSFSLASRAPQSFAARAPPQPSKTPATVTGPFDATTCASSMAARLPCIPKADVLCAGGSSLEPPPRSFCWGGASLLDSSRSFLARLKSRPAATTTTRPASVPAAKARSHGNQPAGGGASTGAAGAVPAAPRERAAHAFEIFDHGCQFAWICLEPISCSALARRVQRAGRESLSYPFAILAAA